ncbi:15440_t:CDS:2 [Dentiscutata erythropus]|uniref:15440_t:CDS:1 n=1 Tax=Dentiscutata erythropus TaxID=1348616 RepID=A0A9N9F645_9GLOM|nr:15440_t:CDS:2 [Dentiscutata erythropus]
MNDFPNVTVNSFDAPSDHPDGGISISIKSTINNPSQISVELGDVMFDIVHMNQTIGQVFSTNFTLIQGDNKLSLEGRLLPQNSPAGVAAVSDMFSKFIAGDDSSINVVARTVKPNNSASPISWLQDAFNGTELDVIFPGRKNLSIIHGVTIDSLDLEFSTTDQYTPMASSSLLTASFSIPFGFKLFVKQISQDIELFDGQTKLATLSIPFTTASGDSESGNLTSSFAPTQFKVVPGSENDFDDFAKRLTVEENVTLTMKGIANVISNTSIGNVTIDGIKFEVQTTLQGIQGLTSSPTVINSLKVTGGSAEHINIELLVSLSNPSNVKIGLNSDVIFDLICNDTIIGSVIIPNLVLERGQNNLTVLAQFSPNGDEARQVGQNLLNNFLAGKPNNVSIKGNSNSTTIEPLRQAFETIELTTVMPGLVTETPILNRTFFSIRFNSLFDKKGKASIEIFNPLDTVIRFLKIDANVTVKNELIGIINQTFNENEQIVVQGGQSLISNDMELELKISVKAIKSLVDAVNGDLKVNVTSNITISVGDENGGFVTDIDYSQNEVPTVLKNKNQNDILPFFNY